MELNRQLESGVGIDALRQTIALLSMELEKESGPGTRSLGTAKVAVVLPSAHIQVAETDISTPSIVPTIPAATDSAKSSPKPKPKTTPLVLFDEELTIESVPGSSNHSPAYDVMEEVPTLYMHKGMELNERLQLESSSLNDQLKVSSTERLDLLREGPIKDLRKGIGINERFQFIKELFRDDEAMYERSIKTINQFQILPEAEFWINRELKTKLGWPLEHPLVKQFDQLIRRRFS